MLNLWITWSVVRGADEFNLERQLDVCDADSASAGLLGVTILVPR